MRTTIRINRVFRFSSPENLLVNAGYYYYNKKGGGHSYIKPDNPHGRYEAHVRNNGIEIHYDVWIGKKGHMTLPSTYTLQEEEKRLRKMMSGEIPISPRINKKRRAKKTRRKERKQKGIILTNYTPKKDTLSQQDLLSINWKKVKLSTKNGEEAIYPQSTTCIYIKSMIRWIKTKVTPWLGTNKKL